MEIASVNAGDVLTELGRELPKADSETAPVCLTPIHPVAENYNHSDG
jgi:hypothetical protein